MTSRAPLLLAFTLLGLAAASAATWVHADLVRHPDLSSVCDISATVNCTEAYASTYGKLAGVPVAILGLVFFAGLLLLQTSARVFRVPDRARGGMPSPCRCPVWRLRLPGDRLLLVLPWSVCSAHDRHPTLVVCVMVPITHSRSRPSPAVSPLSEGSAPVRAVALGLASRPPPSPWSRVPACRRGAVVRRRWRRARVRGAAAGEMARRRPRI